MKVNVIATCLDENGDEQEKVLYRCKNHPQAEAWVIEHEQDISDDPEIYAVYIKTV